MRASGHSPSLAVQALAPLVHLLRSKEVPVQAFFAGFGIDGDTLEQPEGRIPLALLDAIWHRAAAVTADDCVGLHAADALSAGSFGVLSYLGVSSATLGEALARVFNHFRLLSDASEYRIELGNGVVRLTAHQYVIGPAPVRQRVEFTVGTMFRYCHDFVAGGFEASDVFLEHPAPARVREHRRFFGRTPRFGVGPSGFTFDSHFLDRPMRTSDPDLVRILERHAQHMLADRPRLETTADGLRRLLLCHGVQARKSLAHWARLLGTSARTMQRRLRQEGTSYRAVVDATRIASACQLITRPDIGIPQVAAALGFSEVATFHRAFRRWTGLTPAGFRQALREGAQVSNDVAPGVFGQVFGARGPVDGGR